jgi:hypothetical protein
VRIEPRTYDIEQLNRRHRQGKINPRPQYQRTAVWSEHRKQLLIDSILRGYDVPKLYFRVMPAEDQFEYEVVDGQQRLSAVFQFSDDRFKLPKESADLPCGDAADKRFSDLSSSQQDLLANFQFACSLIHEATDLEIRELFLRLQEGVSLNPAEKRNALEGGMRDFVAKIADSHRVFPLTYLSKKRYHWHDLLAIVTCLIRAGGPTEVKAQQLKAMYEQERSFSETDRVAKDVKKILNRIAKMLADRPPEMDIKWGFVDLCLLVYKLDKDFAMKDRYGDILGVYVQVEKERREKPDLSELTGDPWRQDLATYIRAFETGGGTSDSVGARHKVFMRLTLRDLADLVPLDKSRAFSQHQRTVLYRNAEQRCQECKKRIDFVAMHADHVKPFSRGGKTTIENGQCLCQPCNLNKSDS